MAYCTLADVKSELNITGTGDDALITRKIASAQNRLDQLIGCTFEASADSTRKFDASADVEGLELYFDYPCASITTITNGDDVEVTSSEYVTEPRNSTPYWSVKILGSANKKWEYDSTTLDSENAIEITGKWAWAETAPADIQELCIRLSAYLYRQKDAQIFDVTAIPDAGVITIPKGIPEDVWRQIQVWRERVRLR